MVERLIELGSSCNTICLAGDHEDMLLDSLTSVSKLKKWLRNGGDATLKSYGWNAGSEINVKKLLPRQHLEHFDGCINYFQTETHIFLHAGYVPETSIEEQPDLALKWRVSNRQTKPHCSGKTVIAGHTAQRSGLILDIGHLKCIDTNCCHGGWLTAMDVASGQSWQANQKSEFRHHPELPR